MKILCFGDAHFHMFTEFAEIDEVYGNTRFRQQIEAITYMRNYCLDNEIELVLFSGDLFHKRRTIDQTVKNMVRDEIKKFGEDGIRMVMISGNHDQVDNSDYPQHSLHSFKELKKVDVLDRFDPHYLEINGEEIFIYPVPYSKNAEMIKKAINRYAEHAEAREEACNILLMHLGVSGAYVGKGSYSMSDAFSIVDLHPEAFHFGVAGHFHKRQFLGGHPRFFYTGAPVQHSFSDEGEDKGFMVIDTQTGTVEFVPIPAPKFITIKIKEMTEGLMDLLEADMKGNFIRFQIDSEVVETLKDQLPEEAKYRLEVQKEFKEEKRVDVDVSMPFHELVTKWAKEFMPDAEEVGQEILREAEGV